MARPTFVAWHNLVNDYSRTGIALAGICFSLLMTFLQLGLLDATLRTATVVLDKLDFDVVIVARHYHYLADAGSFPRSRIRQALAVQEVLSAVPLYVRSGTWRSLGPPGEGGEVWKRRPILVLGCDPSERPFRSTASDESTGLDQNFDLLSEPGALLVDRMSRKEFGPLVTGTEVQLNHERFEIAGQFRMGTGFAADGAALLGSRNFTRAFGPSALERTTFGLVRIQDPTRATVVAQQLRTMLPVQDIRVFTRSEIMKREQFYWVREKAIGSLFVMGVVISFLVGLVVVYQVLSSDIADHLGEYATLKAIGHGSARVRSIVIQQALILGMMGYGLALVLAVPLYIWVEHWANLSMSLAWWILLIPAILSCVMTTGSGLLSIRKISMADPADLFR